MECYNHIFMAHEGNLVGLNHEGVVYFDSLFTIRGKVDYSPRELVNRNKTLATHFSYCPNCGGKINWRKVRELADTFDEILYPCFEEGEE